SEIPYGRRRNTYQSYIVEYFINKKKVLVTYKKRTYAGLEVIISDCFFLNFSYVVVNYFLTLTTVHLIRNSFQNPVSNIFHPFQDCNSESGVRKFLSR